jgi:hypothetical protein
MLRGITLFDEDTGAKQWHFGANGNRLGAAAFDRGLCLLDGSINPSFSAETNLLIVARQDTPPDGITTWIGLYRHAHERRSGKGNRGAGIWLLNASASADAVLPFLHTLADRWAEGGFGSARPPEPWDLLDPGHALLQGFKDSSAIQPLPPVSPERPHLSGLIDLSPPRSADTAAWLDTAQSEPDLRRYTRIFLSTDTAVSRRIGKFATMIHPAPPPHEPPRAPRRDSDAPTGSYSLAIPMPAGIFKSMEGLERDHGTLKDNIATEIAQMGRRFNRIETDLRTKGRRVAIALGAVAAVSALNLAMTLFGSVLAQPPDRRTAPPPDAPPPVASCVDDPACPEPVLRDIIKQSQDYLRSKTALTETELVNFKSILYRPAIAKKASN